MPSHSGMPEKTACNVCNVSHSFHREETDTETQRSGLRLIDRENTWMRVGKILLMPDGSGLPFLLCTGRGYKQFLFFGAYKCRWPASQHHVPSFPRASQSLTLPNPIYISQHFLHSSTSKPTQTPAQYVWKGRPAYTWAWLPYSEIQPLLSISDCKNQQSYCSAIALPLM
jgi:hypothetical protein